uniref:F-box domain-containing protein n=1 Tax=Kalanchoe fedtschenkoi TaxID=63787 RepID=A0A7N0VG62_KALFE
MEPDASNSPSSEEFRNWAGTSDVPDILNNAQLVCPTWRNVCKDPSMCRSIDLQLRPHSGLDVEKMARHAVDRSCGQLIDVNIAYFATPEFILYLREISARSVDCGFHPAVTCQRRCWRKLLPSFLC